MQSFRKCQQEKASFMREFMDFFKFYVVKKNDIFIPSNHTIE